MAGCAVDLPEMILYLGQVFALVVVLLFFVFQLQN